MKDKIDLVVELIKSYQEYIDLLCDELNEVVPIAHNHGWRSDRVDAGNRIRKKIETLQNQLKIKP